MLRQGLWLLMATMSNPDSVPSSEKALSFAGPHAWNQLPAALTSIYLAIFVNSALEILL